LVNLEAYISSGTLELYVARMLSPEEAQEVERMCLEHPEVAAEVRAIEEALATEASTRVAIPSDDLLDRVMGRIEAEEAQAQAEPPIAPSPKPAPEAPEPQVRPLREEPSGGSRFRTYLIAASALLLASLALNLYLYRNYDQTRSELLALQTENEVMAENFEGLRTNYQLLTDPRYAAIRMTGQEVSPQSYATAVWNAESGKLFLDAGNLPETASDKWLVVLFEGAKRW
jgi:hypothetical protein